MFASALFDTLMNGVFAVERRIKIDSGIPIPGGPEDVRRVGKKKRNPVVSASSSVRNRSVYDGKIHVLVVEDNRVNQIVAKNLLQEAGLTCDIANNGNEACTAIRENRYDIVLMDCQMPVMNGYEATDLIRRWEREQGRRRIPIIALTANATKEDIQKCLDAGMDAYCSKPINPQTVIRMIEEWYEKNGLNIPT